MLKMHQIEEIYSLYDSGYNQSKIAGELGNCHFAWAPAPLCLSNFSPNTINLLSFRIKKKDRLCCLVGHFWLSLGLQI